MKKWTAVVAALALVGCGGWNPTPQPPEPPPIEPPWECPLEMPECGEVAQTCSTEESPCWHNPTQNPEHCEKAADCPTNPEPPDPEPPDPPPTDPDWAACEARYSSGVCLTGKPVAGAYWLYGEVSGSNNQVCTGKGCVADFTPKINNRARCEHYGFIIGGNPRQSCPTVQDGDPRRLASEQELIGGEMGVWGSNGVTRKGTGWKFAVKEGNGTINVCFPNGKACSRVLVHKD